MDLMPEGGQQRDLFNYSTNDVKASNLMTTMDAVNHKCGRGTIELASEGLDKSWPMRRDFKKS